MGENFIHLQCHSCYSMGSGATGIAALFDRARELAMPALAITDTNALHGAVIAQKEGERTGVRPIIGAVVDDPDPVGWPSARHAVLLARDATGYAEICRAVTSRRMNPEDFSLPRIVAELSDHVIVITGDVGALETIRLADDGAHRYVALVDHGEPGSVRRIRDLLALARRLDLPTVAVNAVHFIAPEDYQLHRLLAAIRTNTTVNTLPPGAAMPAEAWFKPPDMMRRIFHELPDACGRTVEIAESCGFRFALEEKLFPLYEGIRTPSPLRGTPPCQGGANYIEPPSGRLFRLAHEGLIRRYTTPAAAAIARLDYELSVINQLGYNEYFLIVRDIVNEARRLAIPTIGRGSAANSLVLYALGVTDVCPLALNLYFERFLNPGRTDMPDIDLDFPWNRREEILRFVYDRFGHGNVAMIGAHVTYRGRGAIREVGKAMGLTGDELSRFTRRLPGWFNVKDIDAAVATLPECRGLPIHREPWRSIIALAKRIEGFPRVLSTHCSGIVVSPKPVTDFTPLELSGRGLAITQLDMHGIEDIGLVKIDLLGQRALAVVADVMREVRERYGVTIDWDVINPGQDAATRRRMREGQTMGCFYIESPAMRGLLKKLKCDDFNTLVAASSIIRPGVSSSGMMKAYIERHFGREDPVYLWPPLRDVLGETYGVMVYQEDVIKVAHAVAGMSLAEADALRRLMSGRSGNDAMRRHRARFMSGAAANGVPKSTAAEIWRQIESFGGYAFCKAHSASFAVVSWRTAYLKEHYPAEFMAGVIANHGGFYGSSAYLEETRRMGIRILPPDVNASGKECAAEVSPGAARADAIRIGLSHVKGLPERGIESLIANRPYRSIGDFINRSGVGKAEAETLAMVGALDGFGYPRPALLLAILGRNGGRAARLLDVEPPLPPVNPYSFEELLRYEWELLGLTVWAHPLAMWGNALPRDVIKARDLARHVGRPVRLIGWLVHVQRTHTANGEPMIFLTMEDATASYEVTLFPRAYQRCGQALAGRSRVPYLIEGVVQDEDGDIIVNGDSLAALVRGGSTQSSPHVPRAIPEESSHATQRLINAL